MFGVISRSKATHVPVLKFGTIHNHATSTNIAVANYLAFFRYRDCSAYWARGAGRRRDIASGLARGCLANPSLVVRRSTQCFPESLRHRVSPV